MGPLGLQPSELAKVAFILALARYLMYRETYRRRWDYCFRWGLGGADAADSQKARLGHASLFLPVCFDVVCGRRAGGDLIWLTLLAGPL